MPSSATAWSTWSSPATKGTPNPHQLRNAGPCVPQARSRRPARTATLSTLPAPAARSLRWVRGGTDDDDRAGGAGDDVLADRAEQHPREAAAAPAADDEQGRIR